MVRCIWSFLDSDVLFEFRPGAFHPPVLIRVARSGASTWVCRKVPLVRLVVIDANSVLDGSAPDGVPTRGNQNAVRVRCRDVYEFIFFIAG